MTLPRIDSGVLRHRIDVLVNTPFYDAVGQEQASWSLWIQRWAKIESIAGGEFIQNQQIRNLSSHTVTMRYLPGLNPRNQISFQGRTFNIVAVIDLEERKIVHQVFVKEVV